MIYLDYNATTPCAPEVVEAMLPYFSERFANPSATTYSAAWIVDEVVKKSRKQVAEYLQVDSKEICFTSGATESINTILKGLYTLYSQTAADDDVLHIITLQTEHSAVLQTCKYLESLGCKVTYLPVLNSGVVDIFQFEKAIEKGTFLAAISLANNETGIIQPIEEISLICKQHKIILFSDTTQAIGKIPVHPRAMGIDIACISGHKVYAPKGIGAIYLSRNAPRINLTPLLHGGSQENGWRAGTLNVPGIVALGTAITINDIGKYKEIEKWRNEIELSLLTHFDVLINGKDVARLPNVSNISIKNINAQSLIKHVSHTLAISLGSACNAGTNKPSHVLEAMQVPIDYINGSIRISLGIYTKEAEIFTTIDLLKENINTLLNT